MKIKQNLDKILTGLGGLGVGFAWASRWILPNPQEKLDYIIASALLGGISTLVGYGIYFKNLRKGAIEERNRINERYNVERARIAEESRIRREEWNREDEQFRQREELLLDELKLSIMGDSHQNSSKKYFRQRPNPSISRRVASERGYLKLI